ncbi:MAG: iron-containing alcohol dehydrogenase [Clostridia bacterium]|nr:iron-containing alcohol dehydrogenase [Clostridia bacterium]
MATAFKVVDASYRIGCGRYIQESGALRRLPEEVKRLGCIRAFVIYDSNTLRIAGELVRTQLDEGGIPFEYHVYDAFCTRAEAERITAMPGFIQAGTVIGVGGGNILDLAKLCAVMAEKPVICVPTSSATCAAYTPLSVTYNDRFQTMGTIHHLVEVNAVLADMDILCRQPPRLMAAGAYDALAKMIETAQRFKDRPESEIDIGMRAAYELSRFTYQRLTEDLPQALQDTAAGIPSKAVYDVIHMSIAITGVISGLARGSNQTAIAHKVYESSRTLYPDIVRSYLHGELVAIGLIAQLYYNGEPEKAADLRSRLRGDRLPASLRDVGIPPTDEALEGFYQAVLGSSAMAGTNEEEHALLRAALREIQ